MPLRVNGRFRYSPEELEETRQREASYETKMFSPGEVKAVAHGNRWLIECGQDADHVGSYSDDYFTREEAVADFQGHRCH